MSQVNCIACCSAKVYPTGDTGTIENTATGEEVEAEEYECVECHCTWLE